MKLSDVGTLIALCAYFAVPDPELLDYIYEEYGKRYTRPALSQYRRRAGIQKNTQAEYIAARYGAQIVSRYQAGENLKQIAETLGEEPRYVSEALRITGDTTEQRCTKTLLLTSFRVDIVRLVATGTSCREGVEVLEAKYGLRCSKNVVNAAMNAITDADGDKSLKHLLESLAWVFDLPSERRTTLLRALHHQLGLLVDLSDDK